MRWEFLGSRKTAITILALIILACAAGSFIPQGQQGRGQCLLSAKTCPSTRFFQLNDIYRSWWFSGLLAFLGLSLSRCTLKRLKSWPGNAGSLFTHAGLIAILLGALITGLKGERGFLSLYKGQSQDTFVLRRGAATAPLQKLPFKIYLHDFLIDWYESQGDNNPRQIKEFRSRVAVIEDDNRVALTKEILVNHPLQYKGYAFYQSGYDPKDPDWTGLEVSRDPGLPLVYAGFFLLNAGVIIIFYGRRK